MVHDLGPELGDLDLRIAALKALAASSDDLLEQLVRESRQLVGARFAAIQVVEGGRITRVIQDGLTPVKAAAIVGLPSGGGLLAAAASDEAVRLREVHSEPRANGSPAARQRIGSLLGVPMVAGEKRYGHLFFGDKTDLDEFTVRDERLAEVFAIHAAIAIRDASVAATMKSTIDTLTTREWQLETAQRIGRVGSWERDLATNGLTWSSEAHGLLGVDPGEMPTSLEAYLAFVHPEDRRKSTRTIAEMLRGDPAPVDYRIIRRDGSERLVHEVSEVLRDAAGRPRRHIGATQDITEIAMAGAERRRMISALDQIAEGVFIFEPDLTIGYANQAAVRMYGYTLEELVGRELTIISSGVHEPDFFRARYAAAQEGSTWTGEITNRHRDGTLVHAEVSISTLVGPDGQPSGHIEAHRDITARVTAERERERLASAVEQAPNPVWILEPDGTIEFANAAVLRLYGYSAAELIGRDPSMLNSGVETPAFWADMWAAVQGGRTWSGTIVNRAKDGSMVEIDSTVSAILDTDGHVTAVIATDRDVTRERALESDLERSARERDSIEAALRSIDPQATPEQIAAAACAEIVRLSDVGSAAVFDLTPGAESVLGAAGTVALDMPTGAGIPDAVAETLRNRTVAGPWIHDVRKEPISIESPQSGSATTLRSVAYAPFSSPHGTVGVIGIGSHDAQGAERLVDRLGALTTFGSLLGATLGPQLDARHRGTEAQALVRANLESTAFASYFQPIVELDSGRVVGYEALTRFSGHQGPALAFAAAARAGLGIELETATIIGAIKASAQLPADAYVSLNASPEFIISGRLGEFIDGIERQVVIEITEHEPIEDYGVLRRSLAKLGPTVRLAVDDAGAGFASFRHILELAPDFVKLDIGLVRGIDTDPARAALAAGMVFFATERKLLLIAEGIETAGELEVVRHLGVQLGQGFLLGRPRAGGPGSTWNPTVEVDPTT